MGYPKFEYKYLLPNALIDRVRDDIAPFVTVDEHVTKAGGVAYTVRSVYYDTTDLIAYREKREGEALRRKFRIRGYNRQESGALMFLEIKKKADNRLFKYRAPVRPADVRALFDTRDVHMYVASDSEVVREHARRFFYHYDSRNLQPVINIVYERAAFTDGGNPDVRITIDSGLRSARAEVIDDLWNDAATRPAMATHGILEVKFIAGVPAWMRAVIQRYELRRMALSKYTICLESHQHVLPPGFANAGGTGARLPRYSVLRPLM